MLLWTNKFATAKIIFESSNTFRGNIYFAGAGSINVEILTVNLDITLSAAKYGNICFLVTIPIVTE